jgi:hypothetical protein
MPAGGRQRHLAGDRVQVAVDEEQGDLGRWPRRAFADLAALAAAGAPHHQRAALGVLPVVGQQRLAALIEPVDLVHVFRAPGVAVEETAGLQRHEITAYPREMAHEITQLPAFRRFRQLPVQPGYFVVLAVGVVVAELGAAEFVAAQQHGRALREEQRGISMARLDLAAQGVDLRGRRSAPRRPSWRCGFPNGRRCRFPCWLRCAFRRSSRCRKVKPSCAATKLTEAQGLRQRWLNNSAEPDRRAASALRWATSPRQKRRTSSRNWSFHSAKGGGCLPSW